MNPTVEERLAVLEAAWTAHTGHPLSEFDPAEAVANRNAALAHAAETAARALAEAAAVITEPLTDEQRLARLEQALVSATGIKL